MSYHVIEHNGTEYIGPSEYDREDQNAALALFIDMSDANALHPNNPAGVVDYMLGQMPKPTAKNAAYARIELIRHLTAMQRAFKAAYAAHARHQRGPKLPPHQVNKPKPLPEKLIPGQRVEMVDPDTGQIVSVIVPPEPENSAQEPQINSVAVQLNAARTHCFEALDRNARQIKTLEERGDTDAVAEALRQEQERKDQIKSINRESVQIRGYYDVLELAAAAHARYPDVDSVEDIVRAEKIDLRAYGLTYKKLRAFLASFAGSVAA